MSEKPRGFEVLRVSNPVFFCIEAERLINSPSEAEGNGVDHDDTNHICVSHGMCSSTSDFFFFFNCFVLADCLASVDEGRAPPQPWLYYSLRSN